MPWANVDDRMASHPKVIGLTDRGFRLHISGILYCSQHLTDGLISAEVVPILVPRYQTRTLDELTERGLWVVHLEARLYELHDYLQWNRSRDQIESERKRKSQGGRTGAERRWGAT